LAAALEVPTGEQTAFIQFARSSRETVQYSAFTALSAVKPPPTGPIYHLPAPLTALVGRERELDAGCRLLRRADVRLVTLSGPPGTGKTRLSVAIAEQLHGDFADGVCFVPLAAVSEPAMVPAALAQALGVRESSAQPLMATIHTFLRDKYLLLVLDNFEPVVQAAPLVSDLLTNAACLKVLVSSREALRLYGEHWFPVGSLATPDMAALPPLESLRTYAAVQLFVQRAQAVRTEFALTSDNAEPVARICAALDGLPLAIEMAAVRVKWLEPQALLAQLSERLSLLGVTARERTQRQQTLWGAIDWSYDLLDDAERRAFCALGVFVGGCTPVAAHKLLSSKYGDARWDAVLESLADKSLVSYEVSERGAARYMMLETIRQYARDKLAAAGELETMRLQHARYFQQYAEAVEPQLKGREQVAWYSRLDVEHDNLRAATDWAREHGDAALGLRIASALWEFWIARGYQREWLERLNALLAQSEWLELAAQTAEGRQRALARARGLNDAGFFEWHQGHIDAARARLQDARALSRALDYQPGVGVSLRYLGLVANSEGNEAQARDFFEQSLAIWQALDDPYGMSWSFIMLADIALHRNDLPGAQTLYADGARRLRDMGNTTLLAYALRRIGQISMAQGDSARAFSLLKESMALNELVDDRRGVAACLASLAAVALAGGRALEAAQLFGAVAAQLQTLTASLLPADQSVYEQNAAAARQRLGEDAFARAWASGRNLSAEQVLALAQSPGS
jgi:predicted ATPase